MGSLVGRTVVERIPCCLSCSVRLSLRPPLLVLRTSGAAASCDNSTEKRKLP